MDVTIQYSIHNNFSVFCKIALKTKNVFKNQLPFIKASSEINKNIGNIQLIYLGMRNEN